jgi:hypothetical protein
VSARRHRWPLPVWRVKVDRHQVDRWTIPASVVSVPGPDADYARARVIASAQSDAGVPPLRSLRVASLPHTTATRRST